MSRLGNSFDCRPRGVVVRLLAEHDSSRTGHYERVTDGSEGPVMQVSASPLGRLALPAIGLLFTAVGIWFLVISLRSGQLFGIAFSAFWLSGFWWYLLNYSYDTALFANGDVRFRLLWGHRLINASNIKSVKVRRGEGSWLVIRSYGSASSHGQLIAKSRVDSTRRNDESGDQTAPRDSGFLGLISVAARWLSAIQGWEPLGGSPSSCSGTRPISRNEIATSSTEPKSSSGRLSGSKARLPFSLSSSG